MKLIFPNYRIRDNSCNLLTLCIFLFFVFVFPVAAQGFAPEITSRAAVVVDAATGSVVFSKNPHEEIPPASMTKLMTMHLVFQEVAAGRASLDEIIPIGIESWAQSQPRGSSLMFLAPGQIVTLREIMLGLAVPSGNDAAVAAALRFAPSVPDFAAMMTAEARRMGLTRTTFVEPSGVSEHNMTTAAEFALFCIEYLRLYPQSLAEFHSVQEFGFPLAANVAPAFRDNPNTIVQFNRNTLLRTFPGVDGLKTGFIPASGFNVALTAERNNTRFIAVLLGAPTVNCRSADGAALLHWAFANYHTIRPRLPAPGTTRIWMGRENHVELVFDAAAEFTAPAGRGENLSWGFDLIDPLLAPLPAGSRAGDLILFDNLGELRRIPLVTAGEIERGGFFKRLFDRIRLLFRA